MGSLQSLILYGLVLGSLLVLPSESTHAQSIFSWCEKALRGELFQQSSAHVLAYQPEESILDVASELQTSRPEQIKLQYKLPIPFPEGYPIPKHSKGRLMVSFYPPQIRELVLERIYELSELGYIAIQSRYHAETLEIEFKRSEALIPIHHVGDEENEAPDWVSGQNEALQNAFPNSHLFDQLSASYSERDYSTRPEGSILSARTLQGLPADGYAFVLLQGENFLRIGTKHPQIGAKEAVVSAGDIFLKRNPENQQIEVQALSIRSDTYQPPNAAYLVPAVQALWRQGIYSKNLKLLHWDSQTVLLDLTPAP
jgi:hypothetical protein